jgi:hypothetical protein
LLSESHGLLNGGARLVQTALIRIASSKHCVVPRALRRREIATRAFQAPFSLQSCGCRIATEVHHLHFKRSVIWIFNALSQ